MNVITLIMISLIQMTVLLIMLRLDVNNQSMKLFNKCQVTCIHKSFLNHLKNGLNSLFVATTHDASNSLPNAGHLRFVKVKSH